MQNKLEEKLDRVFSLYIRLKYSNHQQYCECYTCGIRLDYREMDCSHFIPRTHRATRWDENNVRVCCQNCNRFLGGMLKCFEENLRDDFGDKAIDNLIKKGMSEKNYSDDEYKELIHFYSCKIKEKGVNIV